MLKIVIVRIVLVCNILAHHTDVFSERLLARDHLPLSQDVLKTFPKLNAKHFIIAVPKLGIVLHELNSNQSIRCGNFSEILNGMASLVQSTTQPNVDRFLQQYGRAIPKYTDIAPKKFGILISLYELCNIFEREYLYIIRNFSAKRIAKKIKLFVFHAGQNIGYMCRYTNVNNIAFDIIAYHEYNENTFLHDIEKTIKWLDRFVIKEIVGSSRPINIPVFYGETSSIYLVPPKGHELLVEKDQQGQILRTIRYHMRLSAPIISSDKIGTVFYKYALFENSVKLDIYSNISVSKSNVLKNLFDSISYIIYNRPWRFTLSPLTEHIKH